ncbi:hypothetical protein SCOCK_200075 [Actinacidiphila cocklensis]|uniref:Uncharacterized protein n=1 Tax=Actinacidiphila cocklensis TaxID=887465 RepID=A0A9W4DNM1_9ACTN|nr:hypothetical protein SCOCK_200075 [Actinacidiphila cocklensis]
MFCLYPAKSSCPGMSQRDSVIPMMGGWRRDRGGVDDSGGRSGGRARDRGELASRGGF